MLPIEPGMSKLTEGEEGGDGPLYASCCLEILGFCFGIEELRNMKTPLSNLKRRRN